MLSKYKNQYSKYLKLVAENEKVTISLRKQLPLTEEEINSLASKYPQLKLI